MADVTASPELRTTDAATGPAEGYDDILIGLDVGSTTVKAVVMDPRDDTILWKDYERHQTKQPEKVFDFLNRITAAFSDVPQDRIRIFITGSGGNMLKDYIGAKFVQEVNAVSLAVEHLYPDAGSVIELGGQDAKIIIWFTDSETGKKRKVPSMNDKCAGGTGAVIDKINAKLGLSSEQMVDLAYYDVKLHPVAGKCGVFAETDINGLQKNGVNPPELMASLFEAIIQQNLSVLTRGNTLRPTVLLLGGPNTFIPAMRDCWKHNIPKIWAERNVQLPPGVDPADLIVVPDNAQYYAAIGSVLYGKSEDPDVGIFTGTEELESFIEFGRTKMRESSGDVGLARSPEELEEFKKLFAIAPWDPVEFSPGEEVQAFIGVDGGSTSTKAVLMDRDGKLLAKSYQLSKGNPLADTQDILADLREYVENQGATLNVLGVGTTGYAKDMLKETLEADVAIVETVAHTKSALHYYDDVDVIVDVGGQDIKVIVLKDGKVKDFKLNTQCSAGNGYFLQSTAAKFGYSVAEFADVAFDAERLPVFGYGCAVFMETDIVNFQQLGWEKREIMAGLAKVLPKNIWLYVVAEPNLNKFGTTFVLQGGTQHNLAAVKSQYDFIKSKVPNVTVRVHQFTGESGAIGAALEAIRVVSERDSTFIGLKAAENLEFTSTRDESTRCSFCKNKCLRTYIDTQTPQGDSRRFIIATCEKGTVEKMEDMKVIKAKLDEIKKANPNFVEKASTEAFRSFSHPKVRSIQDDPEEGDGEAAATPARPERRRGLRSLFRQQKAETPPVAGTAKAPAEVREMRSKVRIAMPRVLNMYTLAPFFQAYFEALGVSFRQIMYSDYTDPLMWYKGSRRGSIDQCFPSKVAIAHIHNLIEKLTAPERAAPHKAKKAEGGPAEHHAAPEPEAPVQRPRDIIFFPIINKLPTSLVNTQDSAACPTVSISPEVCRAAFTKEGDTFAENNIRYVSPGFDMKDKVMFELEMYDCFSDVLKVTEAENKEAIQIAFEVWRRYFDVSLRGEARKVLDKLEDEGKVGVVMLGRPYHNDPGLNHEIMSEIQKNGYPIFSVDSLPQDEDILDRLFGDEVQAGVIADPKDITDVWKNCYSENTNMKVWGAKYVARHPNLVAIDLSSFKCGHDAPVYNTIENIIESSGTPYFTFHDIDENKPTGSIKIRVETIDYFLKRYQEYLQRQKSSEGELEQMVEAYRAHLERASQKAADREARKAAKEVEAAPGHIQISGNSSRLVRRHHEHPIDELGMPHHGQDAWAPVAFDLASKQTNGNGNGNHAPMTVAALRSNGLAENEQALVESRDTAAYDRIRAENTANDVPEDEFASASAACGAPGKDSSPNAFVKIDELPDYAVPPPTEGEESRPVMLLGIELPNKRKVEEEVAAD